MEPSGAAISGFEGWARRDFAARGAKKRMSAADFRTDKNVKAALDDVCRIAARTAKAQIAFVVECMDSKNAIIRGAVGCNAIRLVGNAVIPGLHHDEQPAVICADLDRQPWFQNHPLSAIVPFAKRLLAVSIGPMNTRDATLVVLNPRAAAIRDTATIVVLSDLSRIASYLLSCGQTEHVAKCGAANMPEARNSGDSTGSYDARLSEGGSPRDGCDPLASFLLRTLVRRRSLRSRKSTHYVTLRNWKQPVKDTQIAALRSLKAQLPHPAAVSAIAKEIADAAFELYGGMTFSCIVPVPCGNSGHRRCLSVLLAERVATILGVPFRQPLSGVVSAGASHPHKSAGLPRYQVHEEISGQVLVIDDVATTGTHIERAVDALRAKGASPLAIVWIGG